MEAALNDKFWSKVDVRKSNECWLWMKGQTALGYGRGRLNKKPNYSHRIAYTITNGEIPEKLHILHTCDTPLCCNPNHLYAGTPADNMRDKVKRGRAKGWPLGKSRIKEDTKDV